MNRIKKKSVFFMLNLIFIPKHIHQDYEKIFKYLSCHEEMQKKIEFMISGTLMVIRLLSTKLLLCLISLP